MECHFEKKKVRLSLNHFHISFLSLPQQFMVTQQININVSQIKKKYDFNCQLIIVNVVK